MSGAPLLALCALDDLADPDSRGFERPGAEGLEPCFLVRRGERVYAYRNRCPHTGATLEWLPHRFLTADGELIQCGLHGALFLIETGECVHGPCVGQSLTAIPVLVRAAVVWTVAEPSPDADGSGMA